MTFGAGNAIVIEVPPNGWGPGSVGVPLEVESKFGGPGSPKWWCTEFEESRCEVETALAVEVELGRADAGAFGAEECGTNSVCIVIGPNRQGFDPGGVLHDCKRSEAGARGP